MDTTDPTLLTLTVEHAPGDSPLLVGQAFSVPTTGAVVGRSSGADLILPDPTVSRRHLRLRLDGTQIVVERLTRNNGLFLDGHPVEEQARTDAEQAQLQVGGVLLKLLREAETRHVHENLAPTAPTNKPTEEMGAPIFLVRWDAERCTIGVRSRLLTLTPSASRALGALLDTPGEPVHAWDIQERIGEGNSNLSQLYSLIRSEISALIDEGVLSEGVLRQRITERLGEAATDRGELMRQLIRSRRGYGYLICLRADDVRIEMV
ncbi:MAG: FHA domain-containing protein [Myxococcota bacterium]